MACLAAEEMPGVYSMVSLWVDRVINRMADSEPVVAPIALSPNAWTTNGNQKTNR